MNRLSPTRSKPTALSYNGVPVVYWQEGDIWHAKEFGRKGELQMSPALLDAISADQLYARQKAARTE